MSSKDTESTEGKRKTKRKSTKKESQGSSQDLSQESSQNSQEKKFQLKFIDSNLSSLVKKIEKENSGKKNSKLSVVFARNFCYEVQQIPIEITISETRKLNILEEFILRAAIEFTPPPTTEELAKVLGLDIIFVRTAIERLIKLNCLEASPLKIDITTQGREFYQQGHVFSSSATKLIYGIVEPLKEEMGFQLDTLSTENTDLPSLGELVALESRMPDINQLQITQIQQTILDSESTLLLLEDKQVITDFKIVDKSQTCLQSVSVFVLFDESEGDYTTQVRRERQILESASTWLTELETLQKLYLDLCDENTSPVEDT